MLDHFHMFADNPNATNQDWLQTLAGAILEDPTAEDVIEQVRDDCGLVDPVEPKEASENRNVDRSKIRRSVEELLAETVWPEGEPLITLLNYVFRPQEIPEALLSLANSSEVDPEEVGKLKLLSEFIGTLFVQAGFQKLIADVFIDIFTDYAIEGKIRPPRRLPSWFTGNTVNLPSLAGDRIIVVLSTRFDDPHARAEQFEAMHQETFDARERRRAARNPERDNWIAVQDVDIREHLPSNQAELARLAELCERDESEVLEATVLDELLSRFQASPWSGELKRYDLETRAGRRAAKNFLKQIVHRKRDQWRGILKATGNDES